MTNLALHLPPRWPGVSPLATVDGDEYVQVSWVLRRPGGDGQPELYCLPEDWPTSPAGKLAGLHTLIAAQRQQIEAQQAELERGAEALVQQRLAREVLAVEAEQLRRRVAELEAQAAQPTTATAPATVELDPQAREEIAALTERLAATERQLKEAMAGRQAAIVRSQEEIIARYEADLADLRKRLADAGVQPRRVQGTRVEVPSHPCPECEKSFDTPQGLATHQRRMHPGAAPFRCEQCESEAFAPSLADPKRCIRCAKEEPQQAAG